MIKTRINLSILICIFVCLVMFASGCDKHEHPAEHPENGEKEAQITKDQLAEVIEEYVNQKAAGQGGYFLALDEKTGQQLKLTLVEVHKKRLSKVGDELYFACADFETPEGKMYDLDVFMKGADKDNMNFSKFTIHKEAGKERYTWYQQNGIWKMKEVGSKVELQKEHPAEHPKR